MLTRMPTSIEFRAATNLKIVFGAGRESDLILRRVDTFLDQYNSAARGTAHGKIQLALLGKLYFALDQWLKLADRGSPQVNARRRGGVYDLFRFVVEQLGTETRVPVNLLPNWLITTFGRSLTDHGAEVDLTDHSANYITPEKLEQFRLHFRNGQALQRDWRHNSQALIPANSADIRVNDKDSNPIREGMSGYALDLGGEFYTAPHMTGGANNRNGFFHSSYLGGKEVLCAGEIKIEQGIVREINNDSGHYYPPVQSLVMAVEMLAFHGVNIEEVTVWGHGVVRGDGEEFLKRYRRLEVEERPAGTPGDTHLSRHDQAAVLTAHAKSLEIAEAFRLFQSHCKSGKHSWARRDKCVECKKFSHYFDTFMEAISWRNKERKKKGLSEYGVNDVPIPNPVQLPD